MNRDTHSIEFVVVICLGARAKQRISFGVEAQVENAQLTSSRAAISQRSYQSDRSMS